ncbi:MAG: c-type cytochrome [Chloroflexi bacterium]|nr:c-type cytochrome [Chloroflexota bacterium]
MRAIKLTVLLLSTALLLALAAACAPASTPAPTAVPSTPTPLPLPPTAAPTSAPTSAPAATTASTTTASTTTNTELTDGSLYQISCAACHGQDRAGNTFSKDGQTISVPSLAWDDLSKTYQTEPSRGTVEQQLTLTITKGQDETGSDLNTMMPRWSSLSQAQVDSLIQYLQTTDTTTGTTPTLTPAGADLMGEQLYQAACAACHGKDRAGNTFDKDGQKISVPALAWSDLSTTYQTQPSRGTVEQQLTLAITKGQDETGGDLNAMMPRWSFLSQAQVDSLIQYLQTAGN